MGKKEEIKDNKDHTKYADYKTASDLYEKISKISKDIMLIDQILCEMQKDKAYEEYSYKNICTTPFFYNWFYIFKSPRTKRKSEFYLTKESYVDSKKCFKLCEAELLMIREFKQATLDKYNEAVRELTVKINEF